MNLTTSYLWIAVCAGIILIVGHTFGLMQLSSLEADWWEKSLLAGEFIHLAIHSGLSWYRASNPVVPKLLFLSITLVTFTKVNKCPQVRSIMNGTLGPLHTGVYLLAPEPPHPPQFGTACVLTLDWDVPHSVSVGLISACQAVCSIFWISPWIQPFKLAGLKTFK